jgi:acyl carrier protein
MDLTAGKAVTQFVRELLQRREDTRALTDSESLFASGRLDSLAAVEIVAFLEQKFGIDFSEIDFDIELIDSVDSIVALINAY